MGGSGAVARFIEVEKDCSQLPSVSSPSVLLWKKASCVYTKARIRARAQKFCAMSSVHAKT